MKGTGKATEGLKLPGVVPQDKKSTQFDMKITFFPDKKMDDIVYYKSLHMFKSSSWVSIGFKPKAKDLKTVIEDLNTMEYLKSMDDYETTIVLDGRKVRMGFEGEAADPFETKYSE